MADRVMLFIDYQNAYMRARDAFHNPRTDPHWMGQINPTALGRYITEQPDHTNVTCMEFVSTEGCRTMNEIPEVIEQLAVR